MSVSPSAEEVAAFKLAWAAELVRSGPDAPPDTKTRAGLTAAFRVRQQRTDIRECRECGDVTVLADLCEHCRDAELADAERERWLDSVIY